MGAAWGPAALTTALSPGIPNPSRYEGRLTGFISQPFLRAPFHLSSFHVSSLRYTSRREAAGRSLFISDKLTSDHPPAAFCSMETFTVLQRSQSIPRAVPAPVALRLAPPQTSAGAAPLPAPASSGGTREHRGCHGRGARWLLRARAPRAAASCRGHSGVSAVGARRWGGSGMSQPQGHEGTRRVPARDSRPPRRSRPLSTPGRNPAGTAPGVGKAAPGPRAGSRPPPP